MNNNFNNYLNFKNQSLDSLVAQLL